MSEYYMKMKELITRLAADGYSITGRMIKHYIDIGILQKPYYKCANQALYADFHYIRLKRILSEKKSGKSIAKIKDEIFKENDELLLKAAKEDVDADNIQALVKKYGVVEKEEADLIKQEVGFGRSFSKEELLEKLGSDESFLDLAIDTGVISDKERYDGYDLYILTCVKNLIKVKKHNRNASGQLIERISEISRVNTVANEIATLINDNKDTSWLYTYLFDAIVLEKTNREPKKMSTIEDYNYKYQKALEELEQMEMKKEY